MSTTRPPGSDYTDEPLLDSGAKCHIDDKTPARHGARRASRAPNFAQRVDDGGFTLALAWISSSKSKAYQSASRTERPL